MSSLAMPLLESVLTHRRKILVAWLAVTALAAPGLLRLSTDNSAEVFFVRDADRLERYRRFQMDFGRDQAVRLVVSGPGLRTREGLVWLGELEKKAAALRGVFGAAGLHTHHRPSEGWPPPDPESFWDRVRSDPLDRQAGFVSERRVSAQRGSEGGEGRELTATVLVVLYNLPRQPRERTLGELEDLLARVPSGLESRLETGLVGLPVLQRTMDRELIVFAARFFPLLGLVALALLAAVFRRPLAVLLPLVPTVVCLTLVFGVRGWIGQSLNLVEIVLAPLLFVIALASAVHVQMRFRDLERQPGTEGGDRGDPVATVLATYREKGWPVLWTGLTTMTGFASLAVSGVPPVRSLGLWVAGGLGLITLALFTLFPALLALSRSKGRRPVPAADVSGYDRWAAARGRSWAATAVRHRGRVVLAVALLAGVAAAGLPRLERDTDLLAYLSADHPVREELERLEAAGIGAVTAELVVESADGTHPFTRPEGLEALARLGAELRREPEVLSVFGAGEVVASAGSVQAAAVRPELALLMRVLRTDDGRQARLSVFLPMRGVEELEPVLARLQETARSAFPQARVHLTGRFPLVLAAQGRVLSTMITSLSLTFAIVAGIFFGLFRSLRLTGVALVPNLWPVLCVLGAMGWLGVPLDGTTVMIASVVLGLAVDDTLHTLGRYRHQGRRDPVSTLEHTAPAHVLTTAVLSAGFGVCAFSGFVPIARFGALTVLALVLALAADLLWVPALLADRESPGRADGSTSQHQ